MARVRSREKNNMKTTLDRTNRIFPMLSRYMIGVGALASFLVLAITGVVKIPSIYAIWGLTYRSPIMQVMTTVHDWSGFIFILVVGIHAVLHVKWFVNITKRLLGLKPTA